MNKTPINYLTYMTKNCGCSVDGDFQNRAESVSLSLWHILAA